LAWLILLAALLLLAGLLLAALLLLAGLLLSALLLARFLVWVLIHRSVLSNIDSKRHFNRSRPMARDNARLKNLFHTTARSTLREMCPELAARRRVPLL
jgi:uncharacterized protein (DUF58 family)